MLASTNPETLKRMAIAGSVTFTICLVLLLTVGRGIAEKVFAVPCDTTFVSSETGQISQAPCDENEEEDASSAEKAIFYLIGLGMAVSPALLIPYMLQQRRRSLLLLVGMYYVMIITYAIVINRT